MDEEQCFEDPLVCNCGKCFADGVEEAFKHYNMEDKLASYTTRQKKFVLQMHTLSIEGVRHYEGRMFYSGPGVVVQRHRDMLDVIRATDEYVIWDNMGLGFVIYLGIGG